MAQNSAENGEKNFIFPWKYAKIVRIILNKGSNDNSRNTEEFIFITELKL